MIGLRLIRRIVTFVVLAALALLGLSVAIFSLQGGTKPLSLVTFADVFELDELRDLAGGWLEDLESSGGLARWSALAGALGILLSLFLLLSIVLPFRERLVVLEDDSEGRVAAKPEAIRNFVCSVAARTRGVIGASARVRGRWFSSGGRLRIKALHRGLDSDEQVRERIEKRVLPLGQGFELKTSVVAQATGERKRT